MTQRDLTPAEAAAMERILRFHGCSAPPGEFCGGCVSDLWDLVRASRAVGLEDLRAAFARGALATGGEMWSRESAEYGARLAYPDVAPEVTPEVASLPRCRNCGHLEDDHDGYGGLCDGDVDLESRSQCGCQEFVQSGS